MLQGAWTLASLAKILIIQKSKRTKCYSPHPYIKTHHGPCRVIQNCLKDETNKQTNEQTKQGKMTITSWNPYPFPLVHLWIKC